MEVQKKGVADEVASDLKGLRAELKALKASFAEALQAKTCLCVSKVDAARLEKLAAANSVPSMPLFLRKLQTNKDNNITPEIVKEAIDSITEEALDELCDDKANKGSREVLREAVLRNIRLLIRGQSESIRMVPNLPRGQTLYDVPEASPAVADAMFRSWTLEHQIREALSRRKQDPEVIQAQQRLKERVEAFFVRTALSAQRLVVEGRQYRLVRRISVRKPKIGIGRLEKLLDEILKDFSGGSFRPAELARALQVQVASVAPESKSVVSLCAIKPAETAAAPAPG